MFVVVEKYLEDYMGERDWMTSSLHGSGATPKSAIKVAEKTVLREWERSLAEVTDEVDGEAMAEETLLLALDLNLQEQRKSRIFSLPLGI